MIAPANRHDSVFPPPALGKLSRFGFHLPERICVHLDTGYDSTAIRELLTERGCTAPSTVAATAATTVVMATGTVLDTRGRAAAWT